MKKLILYICLLISSYSYGQDWKYFKIDSNLSMRLPGYPNLIDTMGQRLISAETGSGIIVISQINHVGDKRAAIKNVQALLEYYEGIQEGYVKGAKGTLISSGVVNIGELRLGTFNMKARKNGAAQIHNNMALFMKDKTYLIQYLHADDATDVFIDKEIKTLFSGLKIRNGITAADQLSVTGKDSMGYKIGYGIGKIAGFLIVAAIIMIPVIIIIVIRRKRKKEQHKIIDSNFP